MAYRNEAPKPQKGKIETDNGTITIKSDLRLKPFVYGYDVPKSVLKNQFDYLDDPAADVETEYFDGFFQYRGNWYHRDDFMRTTGLMAKLGWDGVVSDTYFSGVLIALSNDGEEYIVGAYYS